MSYFTISIDVKSGEIPVCKTIQKYLKQHLIFDIWNVLAQTDNFFHKKINDENLFSEPWNWLSTLSLFNVFWSSSASTKGAPFMPTLNCDA